MDGEGAGPPAAGEVTEAVAVVAVLVGLTRKNLGNTTSPQLIKSDLR